MKVKWDFYFPNKIGKSNSLITNYNIISCDKYPSVTQDNGQAPSCLNLIFSDHGQGVVGARLFYLNNKLRSEQ